MTMISSPLSCSPDHNQDAHGANADDDDDHAVNLGPSREHHALGAETSSVALRHLIHILSDKTALPLKI